MRLFRPFAGLCLLVAVAAGPLARAADPAGLPADARDILDARPDSAMAAVLADLPGESLSLDDAVELAASAATDVRIAAADLAAAAEALRSEQGAFDPELFGNATWSGADTPSASLFAGADVLDTGSSLYEAGARMRLKLGTELTASLTSLRLTSNSAFAALDPEYQSVGSLSLRQPLLKGFGPSARSDLDAATGSLGAAEARYFGMRLAVRAAVETAYWELYAAERSHAVTVLVRDRAAAFLADTRLRAEAGLIGPSQVANAEYFLTEAEQAALDTEENLDRLSDRLASLTGRRPAGPRFRPDDDPPAAFAVPPVDSLVALGLRHNPDLQALDRAADARRALARGAAWDARPTLDLVGGLGGNGLAGAPRDVFFPGSTDPVRTSVDGDRGEALSQALGRDHPTWNVGLVFALPLGGREAGGERGRLDAQVVRAEQEVVAARRLVEENVRARHRELARGRVRLDSATRGVDASIRQVEIGLLDYRNGRTTAFEVVRLAADLATAQQRYAEALVRTARAVASLRHLTGGRYTGLADSNTANRENGS